MSSSLRAPSLDALVDVAREAARLELLSPEARLAWAVERYGERLLFTSSFGTGSGVLLHMWSVVARGLPVVCIDTGFLFDETIAYRAALVAQLGLRLEVVRPAQPTADFLVEHGADIQARDPDLCCAVNKVAPLAPLLARADAWVSGLRRDQGPTRATTPILVSPPDGGPLKLHPLATMTQSEATAYLARHNLPEHPLLQRRYLSVGCWPCTLPVDDDDAENGGRGGRWRGHGKTECGLHVPNRIPAAGAALDVHSPDVRKR